MTLPIIFDNRVGADIDQQINAELYSTHYRLQSLEGSALQLNPRGQWIPNTEYVFTLGVRRDYFFGPDGTAYLVLQTHTSTSIAADLAAGKIGDNDSIQLRADLAGTGAGQGAEMVGAIAPSSNAVPRNLKDVIYATARLPDYNNLANALLEADGGYLEFPRNHTAEVDTTIITGPVNINLNGGTLKFVTTGATNCLQMRDRSGVFNGTVELAGSSWAGHGGNACPIVIGDYGPGIGYSDVELSRLTIKTNRPAGVGIFITGDSSFVNVRNITFPDSSTLVTAVSAHWGNANNPSLGTTHPNNISIKNVKIGELSYPTAIDTGSVFLSAAYNVAVENVEIVKAHNSGLYVFAGDYGAYYAPDVIRQRICKGLKIDNVHVLTSSKHGAVVRGDAAFAPGAPNYDIPVRISDCSFIGDIAAPVSGAFGVRILKTSGVKLVNTQARYFERGVSAGESGSVSAIVINGGEYTNNTTYGAYVVGSTNDAVINNIAAHSNGTSGIYTLANRPIITGNRLGVASDSQQYGIRLAGGTVDAVVQNNRVFGASNSGYWVGGSASDYGVLMLWNNNTVASGVTAMNTAGVFNLLPFAVMQTGASIRKYYIGTGIPTTPPTSGSFTVGDKVFYQTPVSGGKEGVVNVGGTTWREFGNISSV